MRGQKTSKKSDPQAMAQVTSILTRIQPAEQKDRFPPLRQVRIQGVNYQFGHQIAFGSSSTIYQAEDEWGNQLALKQYATTVPDELWRNEVRAMLRYRSSEIVTLHAAFQNEGVGYLIMERFGYGLGRLRNIQINHRPRLVQAVLRTVLAVLHQIHRDGWICGDINPGNVLIDLSKDKKLRGVKLCDLALARPAGEGASVPSVALWCPAPEQLVDVAAGGRQPQVDIYHAAALALQILQGEPLSLSVKDVLAGEVAKSAAAIHPNLGPCLASALSVDPNKRPSAIEFWRSLLAANPNT